MQKQKKGIIIAVIAVVVLAAAMAIIYFTTRQQTTAGTKSFSVEIVHSDGSSNVFNYTAPAEYLGEALRATGLLSDEKSESGLYILVDGEYAIYEENGAYWALFEGEDYAQQGIDETPIVDGGSYSLVYTFA